jgi:hypothetical protein
MNRDEIVRAAYAVALQNPYRHQRDEEPPLPTEIDHHGTPASWIPSRPTRKSAWTNPISGSVNSLVVQRRNNFDNRVVYLLARSQDLWGPVCPGLTAPF